VAADDKSDSVPSDQ